MGDVIRDFEHNVLAALFDNRGVPNLFMVEIQLMLTSI